MSEDTSKTSIRPGDNGPYLVQNLDTLSSKGGSLQTKPMMALCRCGGSRNKPFCDGTHATNGFSSAKQDDRVLDKRENYEAEEITIHDNRGICAHAGFCTDSLSSVFRTRQEPFVDPTGAATDEIIAAVKKCPSGALSYSKGGVEAPAETGGKPSIFVAPNGPYVVSGGPELLDAKMGEGASTEHFDLCRCGASKNKPFCDGSHWNTKFDENA